MIHLRAKHWFLGFMAAALVLSLLFCHRLYRAEHGVKTTTAQQDNSRVIIVDAGHGGFDGGAVGIHGTVEKEINLDIALKLRDMLEEAGYTVVMTRETDTATNDNDNTSTRSKKVSDMRNRLNLTKVYPGSTLVSIHQNKLEGSSSVRGAQIFYSPNLLPRPEHGGALRMRLPFQPGGGGASQYRRIPDQGRLYHLPRHSFV